LARAPNSCNRSRSPSLVVWPWRSCCRS